MENVEAPKPNSYRRNLNAVKKYLYKYDECIYGWMYISIYTHLMSYWISTKCNTTYCCDLGAFCTWSFNFLGLDYQAGEELQSLYSCVGSCICSCIYNCIYSCIYSCIYHLENNCIYSCVYSCIYNCIYSGIYNYTYSCIDNCMYNYLFTCIYAAVYTAVSTAL